MFSSAEFLALWPQFSTLSTAQQQNAFNAGTLLLDNSCGSAVQDANVRMSLLYMLTAHVLQLVAGSNSTPATGVVGRIAAATQGSVSATVEYNTDVTQSEAYFIQTQAGALFWQATAGYRTMFYTPAPSCGPNAPSPSWDAFGVDLQ